MKFPIQLLAGVASALLLGTAQAVVVDLDFNSLPCTQRWTYESTSGFGGVGTEPAESAIMSVSGGTLVGDTTPRRPCPPRPE